jgi:Xaa-Pro dipeptidase
MNTPLRKDFLEKKERLYGYMEQQGYDAAILSRRENFAWFTCGGDNKVLRNTDIGFGVLLITREKIFLIAQYMDLDRIYDDELQGLDIEKISLKWFEKFPTEKAMEIIGNKKVLSDTDIAGADCRTWDIYWLHYPLTKHEISRYKDIGSDVDEILYQVALKIQPGMTEVAIEAELSYEYAKRNMLPKVLLVGSDERIERYRHPVASLKKVDKTVLVHVAAERNGLHANITRMISFDDSLTEELYEKYELLNILQAQAMAMTIPGHPFRDIFEVRRKLLKDSGYADEWENHYPGGVTGYFLGSAQPFMNGETIKEKMPTDYFITLRGAKTEELCISNKAGGEVISCGQFWPTKTYEWETHKYNLPIILKR